MSRPTISPGAFFFLVSCSTPYSIGKKGANLLPCNYSELGEPGRIYEKVPRYQSTS
jgi:hypothetical protein